MTGPQLPTDVIARIVQHSSSYQLNTLRKVNRTFHRLTNERIANLFFAVVQNHTAQLGFTGYPIGTHNEALFRGDMRPPSQIFGLGFTKFNDHAPNIDGEKVHNVVSTSKEASTVRRKYAFKGGYVYAMAGVRGVDTQNFNRLDEVATFYVPPECVIGAVGPIMDYDEDHAVLIMNDPRVQANPNCTLPANIQEEARAVLAELCRAP